LPPRLTVCVLAETEYDGITDGGATAKAGLTGSTQCSVATATRKAIDRTRDRTPREPS